MAEEQMNGMLNKIEKLLVDGQKEVLARIGGVEDRLGAVEERLAGRIDQLEEGQKKLERAIETVHTSMKKEIDVTSGALDYEIKQVGKSVEAVGRKLDDHVKMPAFGG